MHQSLLKSNFSFQWDNDVFPHSFVPNNPRLATALKLLNLDGEFQLSYISHNQNSIIKLTLAEMNVLKNCTFIPAHQYYLSVEKSRALPFLPVPEDQEVKSLTLRDFVEIEKFLITPAQKLWVRQAIEFSPNIGVFSKSTGELMGWCLSYITDEVNAVAVKPEYRQKGIGRLMLSHTIHNRAADNKATHFHVATTNAAVNPSCGKYGFDEISRPEFIMPTATLPLGLTLNDYDE